MGTIGTLGWKNTRNKHLLENLEKLLEGDRLPALKNEMGTIEIKEGLSPTQWLKHRRDTYRLYGFIFLMITVAVIFVIAFTHASQIKSSRDELVEVLTHREQMFTSSVDKLIDQGGYK